MNSEEYKNYNEFLKDGGESKWQKHWDEDKIFEVKKEPNKKKFYGLIEFPYPSGDGLHTGHLRSYTALDIICRKKRMQGYNVLYPIGFDSFGLPTENYAIQKGVNPKIVTQKNIKTFTRQLKEAGFGFDWSRCFSTTDEDYYKWTQWIFIKMFKRGLAYKAKENINWCISCKIGLANEEVVEGKCERCGSEVVKREKEQWILKITQYAERLINDFKLVDYLEKIKTQQINWIGRSEGALIKFKIQPRIKYGTKFKIQEELEVFTTRPDTLFGATFMVVAPEHKIISNLNPESSSGQISNLKEVEDYIGKAKKKSDLERTDLAKEKTGVELKGIKAINPVNNKEIPIFVADYVLSSYGTGAIMAVPAHDERDFEFAKKFNLPIIQTISYDLEDYKKTIKVLELLKIINDKAEKKGIKVWVLGGLACAFYAGVIYRQHDDLDLITKDKKDFDSLIKIFEELDLIKIKEKKLDKELTNYIYTYRNKEEVEIDIGINKYKFGLTKEDFEEEKKCLNQICVLVLSKRYIKNFKKIQLKHAPDKKHQLDLEFLNGRVIIEDGIAINSGEFNGLTTKEFKEKIIKWLEKRSLGKKAVNYKLHDWIFSRQRYWGEPIPMVKCTKCGWVPVPEKDLPVKLPDVDDFMPTEEGDSPLAKVQDWVSTKCPKCGGKARRETDVMPNWAGSNWYFIRYCDPKNNKKMVTREKAKYWLPVDWYNGGMEHTTLHLLYSRFVYKFLYNIGAVPKECGSEPYKKRTAHGMILGKGGIKMSKSKGNVINPDEYVEKYGADTVRLYEMFMGPFDQAIAWDDKGVVGVYRFLSHVWNLQDKLVNNVPKSQTTNSIPYLIRDQTNPKPQIPNSKLTRLLHQTIKKVSGDIGSMRFNTAISQMMILINKMERWGEFVPQDIFEKFVLILSPFAPHLSEELWQRLGHSQSIFKESWPKYEPKLIKEEEIELVIQVNGKVRDKIKAPVDISEEKAKKLAWESEKIKKWLEDKEPKKVIFVKGKLINLVI